MCGARTWTITREHENDPHNTAQNASSHLSDKERKREGESKKKHLGGKDIQNDEMSEDTNESGKEDSTNDE